MLNIKERPAPEQPDVDPATKLSGKILYFIVEFVKPDMNVHHVSATSPPLIVYEFQPFSA